MKSQESLIKPAHPQVLNKFVGINEESFNLNDYAEELHQFEELIEGYDKDPNLASAKQRTDKDYLYDVEPTLMTALSFKPGITAETVYCNSIDS